MDLQKALDELKKHITFKENTAPGDVILVGMPTGIFYGIVQDIEQNIKKNWYNISFKLLILPPVDVTWILRIPQMNGEVFTMDEKEHFVISVDVSPSELPDEQDDQPPRQESPRLTLIKNNDE